jgi:tetratricopeptide (TPR) repeat protein
MIRRMSILVASFAAASLLAVPAAAQLARPRVASPDAPKLLVAHFQRDRMDSALALVVADGVRDRLRQNNLDKFNTFTRGDLNRVLVESGFNADNPLDNEQEVRQVVRFLNAKYLIEGTMVHKGDSILVVGRLTEANGTLPQSTTAVIELPSARVGASTGGEIANRLVAGYNTFDEVQKCRAKLQAGDAAAAQDMANRALRVDPNNSGAWLCIADIRDAQHAPDDSIIGALTNALQRDTLSTPVMRKLASKYEAKNDTTNLLDMLTKILAIDVRDNELRLRTAQLLVRMGRTEDAIKLVNQALITNPASIENLKLKAVAEGAGSHWDSAYAALQTLSEVDSAQVDSLFVLRITNYARQMNDTTKLILWLTRATQKFPSQPSYWPMLADLKYSKADTAGAITAMRQYVTLKPDDPRGQLGLARYMVTSGQVDSALVHADMVHDTTMYQFTGPIYLQAGLKSYRDSIYAVAVQRLQIAKDRSVGQPRALAPAAFFLALSQYRIAAHMDSTAEQLSNCDTARTVKALWDQIEQNMIAGAAQGRDVANQFLSQVIPAYRQREDNMIRRYCH